MDFREFRYMIAVADCQSITKAAAKLYVSQPSLSHLIARVEQELGLDKNYGHKFLDGRLWGRSKG